MSGLLTRHMPEFPAAVTEFLPDIETLYYEGDLTLLRRTAVAVVGSRQCTAYGRTVAKALGTRVGEAGAVLISGMAKGIDAAGHRGALEADGGTVAVLGGGIDHVYPAENRELYRQIAGRGLLLALHPPGYVARPYDFPRRNRLIAALCASLVVVEARNRSGALITAECAAELGRTVYAVPGNITSLYSFGANQLIRDGASPLFRLDDLLDDLGLTRRAPETLAEQLGADERRVWDLLWSGGERSFEELLQETGMKPSELNGILSVLEIKGLIFSAIGKFFIAKF